MTMPVTGLRTSLSSPAVSTVRQPEPMRSQLARQELCGLRLAGRVIRLARTRVVFQNLHIDFVRFPSIPICSFNLQLPSFRDFQP